MGLKLVKNFLNLTPVFWGHFIMIFTLAMVSMFVLYILLMDSDIDDSIEMSFKDSSVYKNFLMNDEVNTKVKDGIMTMTGNVDHKTLAEDMANHLPGVEKVNNLLKTKNKDTAESSDLWINRKIKMSMFFHRHIESGKVIIDVKDGMVNLKGEASNPAQIELITKYAEDIDGVKSVKNEMTVTKIINCETI